MDDSMMLGYIDHHRYEYTQFIKRAFAESKESTEGQSLKFYRFKHEAKLQKKFCLTYKGDYKKYCEGKRC